LSPSQVALHADNQPLAEVLKALAQQTGNRFDDRLPSPGTKVSLAIHNVTFWQAIDAIAAASGTRVDPYARSGLLRLDLRRSPVAVPVSYDGFFRSTLRKIAAVRDFDTGTSTYVAQLEVAWEPRLEPLLLDTRPRDVVFREEQGKDVAVPTEGNVQVPVDGKLALAFDVPLPALPRSAQKIALYQGKLKAIAPTVMVKLSFGTLAELAGAQPGADERRRGAQGMTCTITRVDLLSDRVTVQVRVDLPPGGPALESHQSWVVNNDASLERKDGTKRLFSDYSIERPSMRSAVINYSFKDRGVAARPEEWTFSYRTPAGLVELPFSFSFRDVPLP
jgi:hypothetical protein